MANTINAQGSALFASQLAQQQKTEEERLRAQAAKNKAMGNQFMQLGMDPDVNDQGLSSIGMASMIDGGPVGQIAGLVGAYKSMDAMQKKRGAQQGRQQQRADMLQSMGDDISPEQAMLMSRDPDALKMYFNMSEFKNKQSDRKRENELNDLKLNTLKGKIAAEEKEKKAWTEGFQGRVELLIQNGMPKAEANLMANSENQFGSFLSTKMTKNFQDADFDSLYQENKPFYDEQGITSGSKIKALKSLPTAVVNNMMMKKAADRMRPHIESNLQQIQKLTDQLKQNTSVARKKAEQSLYPDAVVLQRHNDTFATEIENGDKAGLLGENEIETYRQTLINEDRAKDKTFDDRMNAAVMSQPGVGDLLQNISELRQKNQFHITRNPELGAPRQFRTTIGEDKAIKSGAMRPGDMYINHIGENWRIDDDGSKVKATKEEATEYNNRFRSPITKLEMPAKSKLDMGGSREAENNDLVDEVKQTFDPEGTGIHPSEQEVAKRINNKSKEKQELLGQLLTIGAEKRFMDRQDKSGSQKLKDFFTEPISKERRTLEGLLTPQEMNQVDPGDPNNAEPIGIIGSRNGNNVEWESNLDRDIQILKDALARAQGTAIAPQTK